MPTPLEISIALHYRYRAGDFGKGCGDNNWSAPAVRDALARFVEAGLLKQTSGDPNACQYVATDGLRFYVDLLEATQFPILVWQKADA